MSPRSRLGADADPGARNAATAELWVHRDRRIPAVAAAAALTGHPNVLLADAAGVCFALSPELEELLAGMPGRIRGLPSVLSDTPVRMVHSVRGPVLWSETLTARANSYGGEDVFVCRTVERSFDCASNRTLVWLLEHASSAARSLRRREGASGITEMLEPGTIRRVEEIGATARAWRTSARLAPVPGRPPDRLELTRLRRGNRNDPDTDVLLRARGRALQPFTTEDLVSLTDAATGAEHDTVLATFRDAAGADLVLSCSNHVLSCSGARWRHRNHGHLPVGPQEPSAG